MPPMCGSARVRKSDTTKLGLRPKKLGVTEFNLELAGRPQAFRTSDGKAVFVRKLLEAKPLAT